MNVTIVMPFEVVDNSDRRNKFRSLIGYYVRTAMNATVRELAERGKYYRIARDYEVQQVTSGDTLSFAIVNTNPAARFLIGGSVAHVIESPPHMVPRYALLKWAHGNMRQALIAQARIAERGEIVNHPGVAPDLQIMYILDMSMKQLTEIVAKALDRFNEKYGTTEV